MTIEEGRANDRPSVHADGFAGDQRPRVRVEPQGDLSGLESGPSTTDLAIVTDAAIAEILDTKRPVPKHPDREDLGFNEGMLVAATIMRRHADDRLNGQPAAHRDWESFKRWRAHRDHVIDNTISDLGSTPPPPPTYGSDLGKELGITHVWHRIRTRRRLRNARIIWFLLGAASTVTAGLILGWPT